MRNLMCTISRICLIGLLLLGTVPFVSAQDDPKIMGFPEATQARLQEVINSFVTNQELPYVGGMAVAIKIEDLAFWQGAGGYAARNIDAQNNLLPGGTEFTTSTLSRIYSITKTFTAPLVLELAREGYFSLDDPIIKWMPLMPYYNQYNLSTAVTIRQLLYHESGYSDWEDDMQTQMAVAFDPTHEWTPYELMAFTHQVFEPGTDREYAHNNYVFLGAIIEAAVAAKGETKKLQDLYRERFFTPLGLESMYYASREDIGDRGVLAAPHDNISPFNPIFQLTGQPLYPEGYTNISNFPFTAIESLDFAGGGIVANVADVAEWGSALFNGRATSKEVLHDMLKSFSSTPDQYGYLLGYGLKEFKQFTGEYEFIGHNGSAPGYRSVLLYHPDTKTTMVVLTNFAGMSPYDIAKELYKVLAEDIYCGNGSNSDDKLQVCHNGNLLCVDQAAAVTLVKKEATLGACGTIEKPVPPTKPQTDKLTHLRVHPNPADNRTIISFVPEQSGTVSLRLYDVSGNEKAILFEGVVEKGVLKQVVLERGDLKSGVYFVRLQTTAGISQHKLVLNR